MQAFDAVKEAARTKGISLGEVGRALGNSSNYISNGASRGSVPRCDTMAKMAGVCGYGLALVPREDMPDTALEIDGGGKDADS